MTLTSFFFHRSNPIPSCYAPCVNKISRLYSRKFLDLANKFFLEHETKKTTSKG